MVSHDSWVEWNFFFVQWIFCMSIFKTKYHLRNWLGIFASVLHGHYLYFILFVIIHHLSTNKKSNPIHRQPYGSHSNCTSWILGQRPPLTWAKKKLLSTTHKCKLYADWKHPLATYIRRKLFVVFVICIPARKAALLVNIWVFFLKAWTFLWREQKKLFKKRHESCNALTG